MEKHHEETEGHVARLEKVFKIIGEKPQGKTCDAIMGITDEGSEIIKEYKDSPALDAGLLAAAQVSSAASGNYAALDVRPNDAPKN